MKLAILLVMTSVAYADPPADISIDDAVALYRAHNPHLAAARAGTDVVKADVIDADIYPNPTLGVSTSATVAGTPTSGDTIQSGQLEIPILVGKRSHRVHAAEQHVAASMATVAADEADGAAEVRRRFIALLAAQERIRALDETVADAHHVREVVAGRAQAGAKSPYDLERTELAVATVESRLAEAHADAIAAAASLAEAVGLPGWRPHATGTFRPSPAAAPPAIAANHPALVKVHAAEAQASADEDAAHAEAIPTPSLTISGYGTGGPYGIGLGLGLSIPIPLFDRAQGAIARARAGERAAALEVRATQTVLDAQLSRATTVLGARRDALDAFEAGAVARIPKIRTMAEDAYRSGQGGIVEFLDALDTVSDTRLRDLDLIESVIAAELDVHVASTGE